MRIVNNITEKVSRNPSGLLNTLSNKSLKGQQQKSMEDFEIKAKKLLVTSNNAVIEEEKEPSIAIFAGFRTTKGYHPKKQDKPNQDRMLITSKFNNADYQWVFSVLDGHGVDGHKVSQYVRDNLCPFLIKQKLQMHVCGKTLPQKSKQSLERRLEAEEDSLIYYSSVGDYTEINNSKDNDLEYEKLSDEHTIFRQIQNYTKNVLIKKTFENLNNSLK